MTYAKTSPIECGYYSVWFVLAPPKNTHMSRVSLSYAAAAFYPSMRSKTKT